MALTSIGRLALLLGAKTNWIVTFTKPNGTKEVLDKYSMDKPSLGNMDTRNITLKENDEGLGGFRWPPVM